MRATAPTSAPTPDQRVLSTLNKDGSRRWLRPRVSLGRFLTGRRITAYVLIFIFTAIPYINLNQRPLILLDITARRFTIFGSTFLPTDTLLLALFMVGVFVTVFLLTALLGVWCGWTCPQTVYMEFVFRPIERLLDGPPTRRVAKGFRGSGLAKVIKYAIFLLIAAYLAHTFLAYFVGVDQLSQWVRHSPFKHPAGFLVMAATTALMMFDFAFFREQTCIVACPYGRFQSVLLDRQSLIISYDAKRGEPRGKKKADRPVARAVVDSPNVRHLPVLNRAASDECVECLKRTNAVAIAPPAPARGDCIDCLMCVTTCPTGIDIRDGLQMECIGCAQCIDACDEVMDKLQRPRGLIRYSSQATMSGEPRRVLRPRVIVYPLILLIVAGLFGLAVSHREAADVTVLRGLGKPFTEISPGMISNEIRIKIVNRTDRTAEYSFAVEGSQGLRIEAQDAQVEIAAGQSKTTPALVTASATAFTSGGCDVTIRITDGHEFSKAVSYHLLGPAGSGSPGVQP